MSSELEVLKQHITELEAENVEIAELRKENTDLRMEFANFEAERIELKRRIAEILRMTEKERTRCVAKNAKLKTRIEKLESEFRDRITKVEQKQTLNELRGISHNSSNNNLSNFNLVAVPEAIMVPTNSAKHLNGKSLEEIDNFLLEAHKKIVNSEIKQCNKEKKFLRKSAKNQVQDVTSDDVETINNSKLSCDKKTVTIDNDQDLELFLSTGDNISALSFIEDNLSCDMKMITLGSIKLHDESILNNAIEGSTQRLAYWIDEAMKMGLKEILCLYHYSFKFEEKVKNITADGKIKDKTARLMIYKEMLQYLPNVTLVTCSANDISRLNNTQIQNIIDYVNDQVHVILKIVTIGNDQSHTTVEEDETK
ncbi:hypothetical protein C1646_775690 [Rhizophagus diaphanus]|nr:hypothetical protein C1646_775690 [Rhizophagus diaphanus] [Rhizophagus sp. MUCL 43196]